MSRQSSSNHNLWMIIVHTSQWSICMQVATKRTKNWKEENANGTTPILTKWGKAINHKQSDNFYANQAER